jgi:hypothetical protein
MNVPKQCSATVLPKAGAFTPQRIRAWRRRCKRRTTHDSGLCNQHQPNPNHICVVCKTTKPESGCVSLARWHDEKTGISSTGRAWVCLSCQPLYQAGLEKEGKGVFR